VVIDNHLQVTNMAMWFSPFVSVALFHLFLLPNEIRVRVARLRLIPRATTLAATGYLLVFAALFCAYQLYYGNVLVVRDAAVANAISDWALVGALMGGFYALAGRTPPSESDPSDWILLWLLVYLSLAISAFGQGWLLRFGPQRIEVFLWLPLCICSASVLQRMREKEPRSTHALVAIMVGCGLCSIAVSLLCFQGPFDYRPRISPYASYHAEVMSLADAHTMDRLGAGIVLAPIPAGDIVAWRRGNRTVFGTGSFNLSDQPYAMLENYVGTFFSREAPNDFRRDFLERWCVEYVYCPDTWPVAPEVAEQLRAMTELEEVAAEGRAVLFHVIAHEIVIASSSG
jgi:hypothetical protein